MVYVGSELRKIKGNVFEIAGAVLSHPHIGWLATNLRAVYKGVPNLMNIPLSDLEPYTEPTEQAEAEKKPNIGSIAIPVEVDLSDSYWAAYAADLAKEVALQVVHNFGDPKEAAEYAVSVAKAVVEGLKMK